MAQLKVRFTPEAVAEADRAADWYARRSLAASEAFVREIDIAIQEVLTFPEAWPSYRKNCRRRVLSRFPFSIVYRIVGDVLEIVAVVHDKKRPGYWESR